ncbi:hypothetical protein TSAR_012580 [Trichomalopsis sarcophagae]|uniref:Cytochrome c oxidase subunit n=1 Tax=Trichomalopsis sarcophagae TaxID=543379 RepID=A0A232F7V6_9HYME|nr:hypothetical protein TSAR_012580 [Trichomalopsis sarcophagae]
MSPTKAQNTKNDMKQREKTEPKKVSNDEVPVTSSIVLEEEEDPCAPKIKVDDEPIVIRTPGLDPRFQQQNQTLRCYVMYTDFYQCEHLLGEGAEACTWFKNVFTSICPQAWIERWDDFRSENRMPWHKRNHIFPDAPYGKRS